jgi:DNA-binding NarL/FixJ family response regulator
LLNLEKLKVEELSTTPVLSYSSILTTREKEIAAFIMEGKKYKEIATMLFISENTVRKHVENIYEKLSVKNKIELINKIGNFNYTT